MSFPVLWPSRADNETLTTLSYVSGEQLSFVLPQIAGDSSQVGGLYKVLVVMGPGQPRIEAAKQLVVIPQPSNSFKST